MIPIPRGKPTFANIDKLPNISLDTLYCPGNMAEPVPELPRF
jgi:hypothetical protein